MKKISLMVLLCLFLQAGCIGKPPTKPAIPPEGNIRPESAARTFFDALDEGDYQTAADLYGGSYEFLAAMNPDLNPNDGPALLAQGCQFNGLACLQMGEVLSVEETNAGEYQLVIQFLTDNGELFQRGPCCGAGEDDMPPVSEFAVRAVQEGNSTYKVLDLPPYVP